MKKEFKGFIAGTIITGVVMLGIPAFAANITKSINVTFNSVKIALGGKAVSLDNLTYKGSTYVKLSSVCDLLGKTPSWDSKTNTINIVNKKEGQDKKAAIQSGETKPDTNNKAKTDTAKPDSKNTAKTDTAKLDSKDTTKTDTTKPESKDTAKTGENKPATVQESLKLEVKSANALTGGTAVEVVFNKVADKVTAEDIKNYSLKFAYGKKTVVPILSATLDSTGTKVTLVTAGQQEATLYNLTISNVKDTAGNIITTYSNILLGNKSDNPCLDSGNEPLKLLSASSSSDTTVELTFNKNLDEKTAEEIANYKVYAPYGIKGDLNVIKAELCSNHNKVLLTFTKNNKVSNICKVEAANIKDEQGNIIENIKTTDDYGNAIETAKAMFMLAETP